MSNPVTPFSLPDWTPDFLASHPECLPNAEDRVRFAIELAQKNVVEQTGGPFGAVVCEIESGRVVEIGVNQVVPLGLAVAHAEVIALSRAQAKLRSFSLSLGDLPAMELATSSQMCALCLGAVTWSGVQRVAFGATSDDVQDVVGFDEGPVHPQWREELERRGIEVEGPVLRKAARSVLEGYAEHGGTVYNAKAPE